MNEAWRVGHAAARGDASRHVALASVAGGDRDRAVLASRTRPSSASSTRDSSSKSARATFRPRGVSADHQCVVWCNQVIKAVANALIDAVVSHTRDYEADEPPPSEERGKTFSEAEASYEKSDGVLRRRRDGGGGAPRRARLATRR